MNDAENDYDFRYNLRDTIILLGGQREIADLLKKSQDGKITQADIAAIRAYNVGLFAEVKKRLAALNRLRISPVER